ncbi:ABC transporter permease [Candidatus Izimaplasma bacterium ZiA1]|uniref:carbohydrate ABC transporter permease n=1 Tax=Candidatus Izimoplasma sp. ZiA1 TaxID=2024899 RepID=UPI000BAA86A5|nr:ABC transporter permease [Candidatus Izimaplasma bacterium ZiA1]
MVKNKKMKKQNKKPSIKGLRHEEKRLGYIFASPWLIGLFVFGAFPLIFSLYLSFTQYDMVGAPRFIGFDNYRILLTNDVLFWKSLFNTLYHVAIAVPLGIVVGVILALLLNTKIKGMGIYRTLYYLPNVVSIVAMSLLWMWLFQPSFGLVNQILRPFYDLFNMEPLGWYKDADISKLTLIIMGLWTAGGSMVIYLAQMQDIPGELYEAADIDGANWFQKIIKITLPLMTPSIFFNFIMGLIGGFQVFTTAYIMTGGGPSRSTYYYSYYLFDKMIADNAMGSASAMAWILMVITLVITMLALMLNKYVFYMGEQD